MFVWEARCRTALRVGQLAVWVLFYVVVFCRKEGRAVFGVVSAVSLPESWRKGVSR